MSENQRAFLTHMLGALIGKTTMESLKNIFSFSYSTILVVDMRFCRDELLTPSNIKVCFTIYIYNPASTDDTASTRRKMP